MQMHNFNSGPSILPEKVLQQVAASIIDFNNIGLSILEIGHRSTWFEAVLAEAKQLIKQIMQLNDDYEVLFLHGGATTQFLEVPMNLLPANGTAVYFDNGIWGKKAIKEASHFGKVHVAASSADKGHTYINKNYTIPTDAAYLHLTSNNTVEGTQWHQFPTTNVPMVVDMSSDIFSKQEQFSQFKLIYAGAQKNIGAAGVTLVVVHKSILGKVDRYLPPMLDYQQHIANGSMINTPPVISVYITLLTLRWIIEEGGLAEMERRAIERSRLLYSALDSLPLFVPTVAREDRSHMNAVFTLTTTALENEFLAACKQHGMVGIKGHRSVGGLRASMYNAMPLSSVQALVALMTEFNNKHYNN